MRAKPVELRWVDARRVGLQLPTAEITRQITDVENVPRITNMWRTSRVCTQTRFLLRQGRQVENSGVLSKNGRGTEGQTSGVDQAGGGDFGADVGAVTPPPRSPCRGVCGSGPGRGGRRQREPVAPGRTFQDEAIVRTAIRAELRPEQVSRGYRHPGAMPPGPGAVAIRGRHTGDGRLFRQRARNRCSDRTQEPSRPIGVHRPRAGTIRAGDSTPTRLPRSRRHCGGVMAGDRARRVAVTSHTGGGRGLPVGLDCRGCADRHGQRPRGRRALCRPVAVYRGPATGGAKPGSCWRRYRPPSRRTHRRPHNASKAAMSRTSDQAHRTQQRGKGVAGSHDEANMINATVHFVPSGASRGACPRSPWSGATFSARAPSGDCGGCRPWWSMATTLTCTRSRCPRSWPANCPRRGRRGASRPGNRPDPTRPAKRWGGFRDERRQPMIATTSTPATCLLCGRAEGRGAWQLCPGCRGGLAARSAQRQRTMRPALCTGCGRQPPERGAA